MFKRIITVIVSIVIMLIVSTALYARNSSFSCISQFSIVRNINTVNTRAEGFAFFDLSDDHLLINIDGLLTQNNKKYIISRTVSVKYKSYNINANLYKILHVRMTRDDSDNVNDKIANGLLFSEGGEGKLIFIKKINDDMILFGNHTFPQYGCKRR
ncbi:FidL-like protein [Trabulsiella odontotermitis]|uniref:FidL-like protein n=1 Tax=Trabulsiella odontotermitis TaxID=379893 RepID=UPI0024B77415|nr:FidL-like protein [Trabulsiella odontotermitis]WHP31871.1 FidL-like protein [Trabulsiella odontotermitis]